MTKKLNIFSMPMVREVANKTQVISDTNPMINREVVLKQNLFTSGLKSHTSRDLNKTMIGELLPSSLLETDAVALYTIAEKRLPRTTERFNTVAINKENRDIDEELFKSINN